MPLWVPGDATGNNVLQGKKFSAGTLLNATGSYVPVKNQRYAQTISYIAYNPGLFFTNIATFPASSEGLFAIAPSGLVPYFIRLSGYGRLVLWDDGNREQIITTTLGGVADVHSLMFIGNGKMSRGIGSTFNEITLPAGFIFTVR